MNCNDIERNSWYSDDANSSAVERIDMKIGKHVNVPLSINPEHVGVPLTFHIMPLHVKIIICPIIGFTTKDLQK